MVRSGALIADKIAMLERKTTLLQRGRYLPPPAPKEISPARKTPTPQAAQASPQGEKPDRSDADSSTAGEEEQDDGDSSTDETSTESSEGSSAASNSEESVEALSGSEPSEDGPGGASGQSRHSSQSPATAGPPQNTTSLLPAVASEPSSARKLPVLSRGHGERHRGEEEHAAVVPRKPPQPPSCSSSSSSKLRKTSRETSPAPSCCHPNPHSHHGSLDRRRPHNHHHPHHNNHSHHRHVRDGKARSAVVEASVDPRSFFCYSSQPQLDLTAPDCWCLPALRPQPGCCSHHCCPGPHALPPPCCHALRGACQGQAGSQDGGAEERVRRLQAENERLQLQVAVLSERIDVQVDKMAEMDAGLSERKRALQQAEDRLQREMLTRSSLETQKLELLSSVTELKRQLVALSRENADLRDSQVVKLPVKPPVKPRSYFPGQAGQLLRDVSPSPGSPLHRSTASPGLEHAESCREIRELTRDIPPPRTPPASYRQRVHQYQSLPRDSAEGCSVPGGEPPATAVTNGTNNNVSMKKGVVFADAERVVIQDETDRSVALSPLASPSLSVAKSKGIKKILGRMKRSGSGNLDDLPGDTEFRRGGVRATAGGRLGWSSSSNALSARSQLPFAQWDREAISEWLCSMGLEHCAQEGRGWIVSGAQLLSASPHDLEKELGIKNQLHRKKLRLALQERTDTGLAVDPQLGVASTLDTCWVLRWLDDSGLPQLKEQFGAARVDGRMLHRLTMDDLAALHVTSVLHVASLRTGIQVLRDNSFEPNCLVRRSAPMEDIEDMAPKKEGDDNSEDVSNQQREVALWTNHRVMEWLRVVDLAEYAPNLRGSGVHGGLMVHEPRFTAELLASLLSIPPSKTLLRRHLNTHFKELLGRDVILAKRQAEATLGYTPLTPTAKIKVPKKSQFSLKRQKTKAEVEFGDLVCPLENSHVPLMEVSSGDRGVGDGTSVAEPPKLSVACPENDGSFSTQDSHSGRTSTV